MTCERSALKNKTCLYDVYMFYYMKIFKLCLFPTSTSSFSCCFSMIILGYLCAISFFFTLSPCEINRANFAIAFYGMIARSLLIALPQFSYMVFTVFELLIHVFKNSFCVNAKRFLPGTYILSAWFYLFLLDFYMTSPHKICVRSFNIGVDRGLRVSPSYIGRVIRLKFHTASRIPLSTSHFTLPTWTEKWLEVFCSNMSHTTSRLKREEA